ncbi:DUF1003 domain-containing protein [Mesorhizobium sp. ZC-5]|uniref:DUF1003 domain-containing protein n=1 Tax=Mesorhizobium sp. ZC-5 TaxID=2986066 RepID=UPI0021E7B3DC|nr:DUF1003 domain-containing protein [Mesorhizobium sp. ZC-5]MCV3241389.1 DUF1003 domain-containing protein [Mesorhizobium sp. ZC-5]
MNKTVADLALRWLTRNADSLSDAERRVLQSAIDRKPISRDQFQAHADDQKIGERIADSIARVGGSWTFIISFLIFLVAWSTLNTVLLATGAFDPYPYVFLNLILSMLAALQAPVIMMSQNRQAERDRLDASHDYEVNLKAEIEIMALHEKLDELRHGELLAVRDKLAELTGAVLRLEERLGERGQPG